MLSDDFTGCRYRKGQHIIPADVLRSDSAVHATVWEIKSVMRNASGRPVYHCEAHGFGAIRVAEPDIRTTNQPVSRFPSVPVPVRT